MLALPRFPVELPPRSWVQSKRAKSTPSLPLRLRANDEGREQDLEPPGMTPGLQRRPTTPNGFTAVHCRRPVYASQQCSEGVNAVAITCAVCRAQSGGAIGCRMAGMNGAPAGSGGGGKQVCRQGKGRPEYL